MALGAEGVGDSMLLRSVERIHRPTHADADALAVVRPVTGAASYVLNGHQEAALRLVIVGGAGGEGAGQGLGYESLVACAARSSAARRDGGSDLPRPSARRRTPRAAFGLK